MCFLWGNCEGDANGEGVEVIGGNCASWGCFPRAPALANSGQASLAQDQSNIVETLLSQFASDMGWLVGFVKEVQEQQEAQGQPPVHVVWKLTTHTFHYELEIPGILDIPPFIMMMNKMAWDIAEKAGWDVFDAWTPTYAADRAWFSDNAHFHYPLAEHKHQGGLSKVITQMILRQIYSGPAGLGKTADYT